MNKNFEKAGIKDPKIAESCWFFGTYNNPPDDWRGTIEKMEPNYAMAQLEQGEAGTKHI